MRRFTLIAVHVSLEEYSEEYEEIVVDFHDLVVIALCHITEVKGPYHKYLSGCYPSWIDNDIVASYFAKKRIHNYVQEHREVRELEGAEKRERLRRNQEKYLPDRMGAEELPERVSRRGKPEAVEKRMATVVGDDGQEKEVEQIVSVPTPEFRKNLEAKRDKHEGELRASATRFQELLETVDEDGFLVKRPKVTVEPSKQPKGKPKGKSKSIVVEELKGTIQSLKRKLAASDKKASQPPSQEQKVREEEFKACAEQNKVLKRQLEEAQEKIREQGCKIQRLELIQVSASAELKAAVATAKLEAIESMIAKGTPTPSSARLVRTDSQTIHHE